MRFLAPRFFTADHRFVMPRIDPLKLFESVAASSRRQDDRPSAPTRPHFAPVSGPHFIIVAKRMPPRRRKLPMASR